ncbi:cupin domain-containing protein [Microbacterium gorillae]|uniref:cupin domain-containing protein n=1 Tax=Microbacterium gorillae TaxID=1231063 RepID=UPI003D9821F2
MIETPTAASRVSPEEIRIGAGNSRRFQGSDHGAAVSYFYVDNQPGQGSGRHWHPYPETWVVIEGSATFFVGDETIEASAGDTVTAPAFVPHQFLNTGTDTMRLICIHASPVIIQTNLD